MTRASDTTDGATVGPAGAPAEHSSGSRQAGLGGALGSLAAPRIVAISRLSAVDTVRARVIMAVDLGLLAPMERLPDAGEMAHAFGVSRASILRGLAALQEEGVIERRAGRYGGSFVRPGAHHDADVAVRSFIEDDGTVHSLIDERAVLEAGFAGIAAQSRSEEDVARLRELVDRMDATSSWAEFRNLDRAFHRLIAEAARVPLALDLFTRLNEQLDPYFLPYNMGLLHASNHEHRSIAEALARRSSSDATTLVREHVQELHESMYVGLT
ncbi:FCD domain-containing protein [Leucobacter sp. gxy201]|uniref:FadR/GntR family transcriptional regulator n=1 Tax=Leucobacter sp. gxy201 TaxID=2957200 RepID=UPI003DA14EEA